jgi:siroheme synthase
LSFSLTIAKPRHQRQDLSNQFFPLVPTKKRARFLVGAGSGNSGLVTLRAKECIARADVVVHNFLVNPIVFNRAREDAEIINRKKEGSGLTFPQKKITTALIEHALQGKTVVRLTGRVILLFFGRVGEEAQKIAERGIPFDLVPGVTSAVGVLT